MPGRLDDGRFIEVRLDGGEALAFVRGPVNTSTTAVVLLHDRATNARSWELVMRRFPADLAVIAPDLRGRGSAWRLPPSVGLANHVADLDVLLEQLDIDHAIVVGHGFGAEVAAQISDRAFGYLDAPVKRVAGAFSSIPFADPLEKAVLPQDDDILAAAREVLAF